MKSETQATKNDMEKLAQEMHKPARRKFPSRPVLILGPHDLWQADLVDIPQLINYNQGYKYILTVINAFTKVAYAQPLKKKDAIAVTTAFTQILQKATPPKNLHTDEGKEFFNSSFRALMKQYNINHYHTFSDKKASIVERFNRTLKSKMWHQFTLKNTLRWIEMLPDLITQYNDTFHSTIQCKPNQALQHVTNIQKLLYVKKAVEGNSRLTVNDFVRVSRAKHIFEKGYTPNWSEEVFQISKVKNTNPASYILKDLLGEQLQGSFYEKELQSTKLQDFARIEKVISKKVQGGIPMIHVKWLGYDKRFNQWIPDKETINLKTRHKKKP